MGDDKNKVNNVGPTPWGSEPIRGVNYDYLDIDKPPETSPKAIVPEVKEYSVAHAEDFYQRVRGKIVNWAQNAGAGKEVTKYILLIPDLMALMVRLMADPRVSTQLKVEIAAASGYIIVPVDLMPEAVMGPAGLIDDAIVAMIALNRVVQVMGQAGKDVLRQYWDGEDDVLNLMQDLLQRADSFVTGRVWKGIKTFMANAAQDIKTAADDVRQSAQQGRQAKSSGPVIEGSYRPILPANEQGGQINEDDDQQWIIPPNERS